MYDESIGFRFEVRSILIVSCAWGKRLHQSSKENCQWRLESPEKKDFKDVYGFFSIVPTMIIRRNNLSSHMLFFKLFTQ